MKPFDTHIQLDRPEIIELFSEEENVSKVRNQLIELENFIQVALQKIHQKY